VIIDEIDIVGVAAVEAEDDNGKCHLGSVDFLAEMLHFYRSVDTFTSYEFAK